jgi:hypothetical protein
VTLEQLAQGPFILSQFALIIKMHQGNQPMITDTTQDAQIRHSIRKEVMGMNLRMLQRIAYEVRCEEMGIHPDTWQLFPIED